MTELDDLSFRNIVDAMHDGVYVVDRGRRISYWNDAATRITGFSREEAVGSHCFDDLLTHVDAKGTSLCRGLCPLAESMQDGLERECTVYLHHRDGHRLPVRVRVAPLRDADGTVVGAVEVFNEDVRAAAVRERLAELERMALTDPLTRVGNRRYLEASLRARLDELRRYGWALGLLFVDVDEFKGVNDRLGHAVGDEVLRTVAGTLVYSSRTVDVVGRWGGDEFIILMRSLDLEGLEDAAQRLRSLVGTSHVRDGGRSVGVTVSIGGTTAQAGDTMESVVARADRLMYTSKRSGGDRVTVG